MIPATRFWEAFWQTALFLRLRNVASHSLNFILPPRCAVTGELVGMNGTLAPAFWQQLTFIAGSVCACCGNPFPQKVDETLVCGRCLQTPPAYDRARAVLKYDDAAAKLILKFKHADGTALTPLLGAMLAGVDADIIAACDVIIPVPLHRWRLLKRRYNQAALLAHVLARRFDKTYAPQAIRRIRATESQGTKTAVQRHENVKNVFAVFDPDKTLIGRRVVLVDDVLTSGATVEACARVLKKHGASTVDVLCVARVVHTD